MATNPVSTSNMWPNYSKGNVSNKGGKGQELGKDQFLSILITQLRHQDPLQPMQDREFIAQMAQFTSLEQLMNINTQLTAMSQSLGSASSLIGKEISWMEKSVNTDDLTWTETPKDGTDSLVMKTGIVESIIVRDGVHYAKVGSSEVLLSDILRVENPAAEPEEPSQGGAEAGAADALASESAPADVGDPDSGQSDQGEPSAGGNAP